MSLNKHHAMITTISFLATTHPSISFSNDTDKTSCTVS